MGELLRSMPPSSAGKVIIVRVNGLDSRHIEADLDAVVWPALDLLNLPKAESADDILALAKALARLESERGIERHIGILATIESPRACAVRPRSRPPIPASQDCRSDLAISSSRSALIARMRRRSIRCSFRCVLPRVKPVSGPMMRPTPW